MADRIQLRRDTKANWELYNPILATGEPGIVLDYPSLYKIGDGIHPWNQLPLRGFDGNIYQETGDSAIGVMSQKATSEALAALEEKLTTQITQTDSKIGYFVCETAGNQAAKEISAPYYDLSNGGSIKVKMLHKNTADAVISLNINNTGIKPFYYDGEVVTISNTWEDGETVEIYYDGTNFYANNVAGGGTFKSGQKVKNVEIENTLNPNSNNLPTSGGVHAAIETEKNRAEQAENDLSDYIDGKTQDLEDTVKALVEDYKPIVIEGDVTNAPDEEDLTSVNIGGSTNVIKFKDKKFNAVLFSGLGKIHLRKNIVAGDNILTQTMINERNAVYLIQYNYQLDNPKIVVPQNCILKFDGGTFTSGALECNNTLILDPFNVRPLDNLTVTGTYKYFSSEMDLEDYYTKQEVYNKTEVDEKLDDKQNSISDLSEFGNGIGTCSTPAGTTEKEVVLNGYNLVKNGFVAVTFSYDVPAGATLNINSKGAKPIIYKGSAIEADVIKAGDTVIFAYNDSQYVISSISSESFTGTIVANLEAYINDVRTSGAELVGVTVTLTNTTDSEVVDAKTLAAGESSVKFSGLVPMKDYLITVSTINGYTKPEATITELGIGAIITRTLQFEADEYSVSISSNQGSGDTSISGARVTIAGISLSDGDTIKVAKGATINPIASAITDYSSNVTISGKNVSAIYSTEVVTVTCTAEDGAAVTGQTITINNIQYALSVSGVITVKVAFGENYSVVAGDWSGYTTPAEQNFTANSVNRSVSVLWETIKLGVFIESTDGRLYPRLNWASSGKTANAVVVLTSACKVRMALTETALPIHSNYTDPLENYITAKDEASAKVDYDGEGNTNKIIQFNAAYGTNTASYAAPYCKAFSFTFPSGQKGCLPSLGQLWTLYQNKTEVDACLSACGGTAMSTNWIWSSTFWGVGSSDYRHCWVLRWSDGHVDGSSLNLTIRVRPVSAY